MQEVLVNIYCEICHQPVSAFSPSGYNLCSECRQMLSDCFSTPVRDSHVPDSYDDDPFERLLDKLQL